MMICKLNSLWTLKVFFQHTWPPVIANLCVVSLFFNKSSQKLKSSFQKSSFETSKVKTEAVRDIPHPKLSLCLTIDEIYYSNFCWNVYILQYTNSIWNGISKFLHENHTELHWEKILGPKKLNKFSVPALLLFWRFFKFLFIL